MTKPQFLLGRTDDSETNSESAFERLVSVIGTVVPRAIQDRLGGDQVAETAAVPPERTFKTDEEYVHALLEGNNGRIKQSSIVDQTGWSDAKVSRLLCQMEESGSIDRMRIGREKVLLQPGHLDEHFAEDRYRVQ